VTPQSLLRWCRRAAIFVVGITIVLIGVVLVFTPGPAIIVVPAGLAILATEFAWARRMMKPLREKIASMRASMAARGTPPPSPPPDGDA